MLTFSIAIHTIIIFFFLHQICYKISKYFYDVICLAGTRYTVNPCSDRSILNLITPKIRIILLKVSNIIG